MMTLKKIFLLLINIDFIAFTFLLLGLGFFIFGNEIKKKRSRFFLSLSLGIYFFLALTPFPRWSLTYLENRYPLPSSPDELFKEKVAGFILLDGGIDSTISAWRKQASFRITGGRIIPFMQLVDSYKKFHHEMPRILFSGGAFADFHRKLSEADVAKKIFPLFDLDQNLISYEGNSTNTRENASFSASLMKPNKNERWILVTSAFHMSRSMDLFQQAGFNVVPYPVDFHTTGEYSWMPDLTISLSSLHFRYFVGEFAGIIFNQLFPISKIP